MRHVLPTTLALVTIAASAAHAQTATRTPGMPASTARQPAASAPRPGVSSSSSGALGTIQLNLGTLSPPGVVPGTITACPLTLAPGQISTLPAGGITTAGTAATSTPSTPAASSPFGTLTLSGACVPASTNTALNAGSAPGGPAAAPTPPPGTIAASAYGDGTSPLDATETGNVGLSPLLTLPAPDIATPDADATFSTGAMPSNPALPPGN